MISINWAEYKEYKKYTHSKDNFEILLDFMKSYYNMVNPVDIFEILQNDETAQLMLAKRKIQEAEDLENFLFKLR